MKRPSKHQTLKIKKVFLNHRKNYENKNKRFHNYYNIVTLCKKWLLVKQGTSILQLLNTKLIRKVAVKIIVCLFKLNLDCF